MAGMSGNPMVMLAAFFLFSKLDYSKPHIVLACQAGFAVAVVLSLGCYWLIKKRINDKNDATEIWVPPVKVPFFGSGGQAAKHTTYKEHELEQAGLGMQQSLMMAGIMGFLGMQFKLVMPMGVQAILIPANLIQSPLFSKHILGRVVEKPWGESLEKPEEGAAQEGADGAAEGATEGGADKAQEGATGTPTVADGTVDVNSPTGKFLAAVVKAWEDNTLVKRSALEPLLDDGADINVGTLVDNWTALMMSCGYEKPDEDMIQFLIRRGAALDRADGEGETAMHWAASNSCEAGVRLLLKNGSTAEKLVMLRKKNKDGQTALDIARKVAKNTAIIAMLEKAVGGLDVDSDEEEEATTAGAGAGSAATAEDEAVAEALRDEGGDEGGITMDVD